MASGWENDTFAAWIDRIIERLRDELQFNHFSPGKMYKYHFREKLLSAYLHCRHAADAPIDDNHQPFQFRHNPMMKLWAVGLLEILVRFQLRNFVLKNVLLFLDNLSGEPLPIFWKLHPLKLNDNKQEIKTRWLFTTKSVVPSSCHGY